MYVMTKRATVAMRSRKVIHTPREVVRVEFVGDNGQVTTSRRDTMNSLRQLGWRVDRKQKSDAPTRRLVQLQNMTMPQLRKVAGAIGLKGSSKSVLAQKVFEKELTV